MSKPPKKFMPHTRMKEIFGDKPDEFFSPARENLADRAMNVTLQSMEEKALVNMQKAVADMAALVQKLSPGARPEKELDAIADAAFAIKCHAGMYAFPLATQFANQLFYYARKLEKAPLPANVRPIMEAYVHALALIFRDNIKDIASPAAVALLKELERLGELF